jgi:hypothetical protein
MKNQIQEELRNLLNGYLEKLDQGGEPQLSSSIPKRPETDQVQLPEDFNVPPQEDEDATAGLAEHDPKIADEQWTSPPADHLTDLYQKIDLGKVSPETSAGHEFNEDTAVDIPIDQEHGAGYSSIPDLNDDMALSLNDPLDEIETSVRISPSAKKYKR